MTGQQALNLIMGRLSRTNPNLRASALLELNLAQDKIENAMELLPWFLLSEDVTATITADERRVSLPSGFIMEHEESVVLLENEDGTWDEIEKGIYDELINKHGYDATAELPEEYALVGTYLHLFPIPTVERRIRMSKVYLRDDDITDAATANQWLTWAPDLIIGEAGTVVAGQYVKDMEQATIFAAQAARGRADLDKAITAREEANLSRRMG